MVQSVERALKILERVAEYPDGMGVIELAKKMNLPPSTVHRFLFTLMKNGYIKQEMSTERYKIGYKILELARKTLGSQNLRSIALPYLKNLKEKTGETAHIVVLDGESGICIESVESSENNRTCSPVGTKNPLYCTAVGKVLLAYLPQNKQKKSSPKV